MCVLRFDLDTTMEPLEQATMRSSVPLHLLRYAEFASLSREDSRPKYDFLSDQGQSRSRQRRPAAHRAAGEHFKEVCLIDSLRAHRFKVPYKADGPFWAVYVEITMKAAKETEATTAEQHARESIRVARTTRELLKKFAAAYRIFQDLEDSEGHPVTRLEFRGGSTIFTDDDVHDKIAITKELFLLVIQDRDVQRLMDELDLPPDRANLFEVIDADGSGTLHITELVQGLLQIRGEIKKSDTVAALLATKAVQYMVADIREGYEKHFKELKGTLETELQKLNQPTISLNPQRYRPRVASV
eukprot:s12_g35.t1